VNVYYIFACKYVICIDILTVIYGFYTYYRPMTVTASAVDTAHGCDPNTIHIPHLRSVKCITLCNTTALTNNPDTNPSHSYDSNPNPWP